MKYMMSIKLINKWTSNPCQDSSKFGCEMQLAFWVCLQNMMKLFAKNNLSSNSVSKFIHPLNINVQKAKQKLKQLLWGFRIELSSLTRATLC